MEEESRQVVVGYYMSPDGQVIPLMADAKYYPDGVPESPLLTPQPQMARPAAMPSSQPMGAAQPVSMPSSPSMRAAQPVSMPSSPSMRAAQPAFMPSSPPVGVSRPQSVRSVLPAPSSNTKKQDKSLENVVGRNLMGILASILIFIGMILFATVAYEAFSKAARIAFVYAVSGVLLAVGLLGMRKNRNAFYLSLAGCGAGAVYISLFLTYGYFGLINGTVLYLLLALWSFAVFFLGGKGSLLFKTIGQSGVLISAFYGTVMQFMEMKSPAMLSFTLVLMFYYIVVTVFYLLMDSTSGYKANLPSLIMDFIGAAVLTAAAVNIRGQIQMPVQVALTCAILAYTLFLLFLYRQRILKKIETMDSFLGWSVFVFFQSVFAALTIFLLISHDGGNVRWIRGCVAMAQYAALWGLTEYKGRKDIWRAVPLAIVYLFVWGYSGSFGVISDILGIGFFALLFLTAGFFKKDRLYFAFGCVSSFIYILFYGKYPAVYSLFSVLFILLIFFFLLYGDRIYYAGFKLSAYAMLQIFLFRMVGILTAHTVLSRSLWIDAAYLASAVLCIIATHSSFSNDWLGEDQKEKNTQIALGALNIILMLWGLSVLDLKNGEIFHTLSLLALLALCCQNIMPMVRHYEKSPGVGIYTGLKLTLFLQAALYSYQIESYIVTLACLFLALLFITFGFLKNYKSIRLYGLLLSLYSIFKLVMVDVTYHSTLSRALTILGCGVMAFMISFVYNKISKKLEETVDQAKLPETDMPEVKLPEFEMSKYELRTDDTQSEDE